MGLNVENIFKLSIKVGGQKVIGMLSHHAIEPVNIFTSTQGFFFKSPWLYPKLSVTAVSDTQGSMRDAKTAFLAPRNLAL